jgi:hypothetical protein
MITNLNDQVFGVSLVLHTFMAPPFLRDENSPQKCNVADGTNEKYSLPQRT